MYSIILYCDYKYKCTCPKIIIVVPLMPDPALTYFFIIGCPSNHSCTSPDVDDVDDASHVVQMECHMFGL